MAYEANLVNISLLTNKVYVLDKVSCQLVKGEFPVLAPVWVEEFVISTVLVTPLISKPNVKSTLSKLNRQRILLVHHPAVG